MSSDGTYTLTILSDEGSIEELLPVWFTGTVGLFRNKHAEAKHFLDERGKSTGNGGEWRSIEEDLRSFSRGDPDYTFLIVEQLHDWGTTTRHYAKYGKYAAIVPKMVWPEFHEDMLV